MLNKRIKESVRKKVIPILLGALLTLSSILAFNSFMQPTKENVNTQGTRIVDQRNNITDKNIVSEEAILKNIKLEVKSIIASAALTKTITVESGWSDNWFRNAKEITFKGDGIYTLDLQSIGKDCIFINGNDITVYLPNPGTTVSLRSDQYEVKDIKGKLWFGDFKMVPEAMITLETEATNSMLDKMNSDEYMSEAKKLAAKSVEKSIYKITQEKYNVTIKWIN